MSDDILAPLSIFRRKSLKYDQGNILKFKDIYPGEAKIFFVRSGSVEIFERSDCLDFHAYRPVAIFREGPIIGLFEFMDHYCGVTSTEPAKEDWEIAAGHGAVLLITSASETLIDEMYNDIVAGERLDKKRIYEPRDLLEALLESKKTVLDIFVVDNPRMKMREYPMVFDAILGAYQTRMREYRKSRNLYNQGFMIQ